MINVKFSKIEEAVFVSHIDMLRTVSHILRRADIRPHYSKGFNPHMLLKFSAPIPLGLASKAEYFSLDIDGIDKETFSLKFNEKSIKGLNIIAVFESKINPNFAGKIHESDYIIKSNKQLPKDLEEINKKEYIIEYIKKDKTLREDVADKIKNVVISNNELFLTLSSGNYNLRLDRLIDAFNSDYNLDLSLFESVRVAQYLSVDNRVIDVDEYLKKLEYEKDLH